MAPEQRTVTGAELKVLQLLWDQGSATTRRLADILYPGGGVPQYYTVQKLLERLEEKGCVLRDRSGRTHVFSAAFPRGQFVGERLKELSDKLCGGSLVPMFTELVHLRKLRKDEFDALKQLVDELDRKSKRKKRGNERK